MGEPFITSLFENSIIGGAFVYLLWYITRNFKEALDNNTRELARVSKTLTIMDKRIEKLEKGVRDNV